MDIIKIDQSHWEDLKTIRIESLRDSPEAFGATLDEVQGFDDDRWKSILSNDSNLEFFLAYNNGQPIGMIAFVNALTLASMWVNPAHRMEGIGRKLVSTVQSHASSMGHEKIVLKVEAENAQVISFYQKCGFEMVKEPNNEMVWQP
ncbi:GNAT family N-acetyltransferase [Aurantivibrio plasticivorans]